MKPKIQRTKNKSFSDVFYELRNDIDISNIWDSPLKIAKSLNIGKDLVQLEV